MGSDDKLAALHVELGNAITAIKLASEVLLRHAPADEPTRKHLQTISHHSDRAWALAQQLLGQAAQSPPRVVLVDDHDDHREALALLIEDRGYQTSAFGSAGAMLRDLESRGPASLYLLDRTLPDRPGEELVAELRARGVAAPVVVVSGREPSPVQGADGFLGKPVDVNRLEDLLARFAPLPRP